MLCFCLSAVSGLAGHGVELLVNPGPKLEQSTNDFEGPMPLSAHHRHSENSEKGESTEEIEEELKKEEERLEPRSKVPSQLACSQSKSKLPEFHSFYQFLLVNNIWRPPLT